VQVSSSSGISEATVLARASPATTMRLKATNVAYGGGAATVVDDGVQQETKVTHGSF